jgi:hypothetical protein
MDKHTYKRSDAYRSTKVTQYDVRKESILRWCSHAPIAE